MWKQQRRRRRKGSLADNHLSRRKLHQTDSIIRRIVKQTVTDWDSEHAEDEIETDQSKRSAF